MKSITVANLKPGHRDAIQRTVTENDVANFAALTGDYSWLHMDEEIAGSSRFGGRIIHGMYLLGLISAVIGTRLPGHGTIYTGQTSHFLKPAYLGDTITAQVEVKEIIGNRVELYTTCTNQQSEVLVEGVAKVIPPRCSIVNREDLRRYLSMVKEGSKAGVKL